MRRVRTTFVILTAAVLWAGLSCATETSEEQAPVRKAGFALKKEYITERAIPTYVLYSEQFADAKKPVVICVHGGGTFHPPAKFSTSKKEMWLASPGSDDGVYRLAGKGFLVLMIDGWWGGERYKPEYEKLVEENMFAANFRGWRETAEDVSRIIDYLATRRDADATRVGMMGASGGGITGLMAACIEPRLKAVVAWMATCDLSGLGWNLTPGRTAADQIDAVPGLEKDIERFDAAYAYQKIPPIALAIINNKTDPVIPYEKAEKLYEKLKPLYAQCPDRLSFELLDLPQPKHGLPPEGFTHGFEWLEKFLLGAEGTENVKPDRNR
jgi:dienelactone hydrolase